jgi:Tol biopolymer transport system component
MTSPSPGEANSDRWRRIEEICDGALHREPADRAAYLVAECGLDENLRREVETLLAHERSAEKFLAVPVGALAARVLAAPPEPDLVGKRLGDYDIVARLGAGGMGVVYRAKDRRLGREVAIKVLPAVLEVDQARLARFEREARLLATLNHPHVGAIYGLVEAENRHALVLELIEGETLAAALGRGRLPVERTLALAAQMADALDHAHRRGVTHRDLKPSNIMLTPGGAKLLDFGVGRWTPKVGESPLPGFSTVTQEGTIVGTIHYMAPEQLEGRDADARSDLFSFGAVLYEMLAGHKAFDGSSQASIIAAILEAPTPRLSSVGRALSPRLDRVVGKCLAKDPDHRWQSARDLADELKWIADEDAHPPAPAAGVAAMPTTSTQRRSVAKRALAVAGALTVALAGWAAWARWPPQSGAVATGSPIRFVVQPPPGVRMLPGSFDISSDGGQLVYVGSEATSGSRLFVRRLDRFETIPLPGSERGMAPVYSPDGQWVAFTRDDTVNKVGASADSSPVMLADAIGSVAFHVTWPISNALFLATRGKPIRRVFAEGSEPTAVTSVRADAEIDHHSPTLLPGGDALMFGVHGKRNRFSIAVESLRSHERKTLIESAFAPQYSPTGHLVFARGSAILAVPFDVNRLEVTGPPVTLLQQVTTDPKNGVALFRVTATGTLVYQPERSRVGRVLTWVDRAGNETPLPVAARAFDTPRVSPDGKHLAFTAADGERRDIWTYEIANDNLTRMTQEGDNWGPLWTRDGSAVAYATDRADASEVVLQRLDGTAPVTLGSSQNDLWPTAFSLDQKTLIVQEQPPTDDYFVSRLAPDTGRRPQPLIEGPGLPRGATVSPDGRWVAYEADQSGRSEVFIQGFPLAGARRQVTVDGGGEPLWRRDGRELFYRSGSRMFAVPIETTRGLRWGKPTLLFDRNHVVTFLDYDVAPDGRFLMIRPAFEEGAPVQLNVVLNWTSELLSRVPVRR